MSITSVVFVPAAPLLVPAVAGGSAELDADLREACMVALRRALADEPDEVLVLATSPEVGAWTADATWDFSGFGVDRQPPDPRPALPWSLGIGAWLLDDGGWVGARRYVSVVDGESLRWEGLDSWPRLESGRVVLLAVGDGSACRTEKAPGHLDSRAEAFDANVASLLAAGDVPGLAELDTALARDLLCAGLPVWRAVAQSLGGTSVASAEVLANEAPYGVGYFVARWSLTT